MGRLYTYTWRFPRFNWIRGLTIDLHEDADWVDMRLLDGTAGKEEQERRNILGFTIPSKNGLLRHGEMNIGLRPPKEFIKCFGRGSFNTPRRGTKGGTIET